MKTLTDEAIQHWLDEVFPTLPSRTQQMFVDEVFFLTTGLPPIDVDLISASNKEKPSSQVGRPGTTKRNLKAEEDAFWIQRRAAELFGTEEKACVWLTRPHSALKKATPLSRLGTKTGNARVERLLTRIQQGEKGKARQRVDPQGRKI